MVIRNVVIYLRSLAWRDADTYAEYSTDYEGDDGRQTTPDSIDCPHRDEKCREVHQVEVEKICVEISTEVCGSHVETIVTHRYNKP